MNTEPDSAAKPTGLTDSQQDETPFLDSLLREKAARRVSFHMPGHKFDAGLSPRLLDYWGSEVYSADQVEIGGVIDYLHAPQAELAQAQRLAAQVVGADRSFFLINGSTVGNLASLMATVRDGQQVIVPRASHRSVYGGLILSVTPQTGYFTDARAGVLGCVNDSRQQLFTLRCHLLAGGIQ